MRQTINIAFLVSGFAVGYCVGLNPQKESVNYNEGIHSQEKFEPRTNDVHPGMVSTTSRDNRERSNPVQGFIARVTAYCPCT